jgi:hypothetical protein
VINLGPLVVSRMTERYTHLDPEHLHSKLDALMRFQPGRPEPPAAEPAVAAASAPAASSRVS